MNTLACLARSRRDIFDLASSEARLLLESMLSGEEKTEKAEPDELDAREEERETGEDESESEAEGWNGTAGNWVRMGVIHVGSRTSSAIMANNSFSSCESSSNSC